jgi:hypothetical protein
MVLWTERAWRRLARGMKFHTLTEAEILARLEQEHLSFSGLVQTLLGQWMTATAGWSQDQSTLP